MTAWDDFRDKATARLLLPVKSYMFSVSFVDYSFRPEQVAVLSQQISAGVVQAIRNTPQCSLSALTAYAPTQESLVRLTYGHPVYDFQVQLHNDTLLIAKQNFTLEDFVVALPLLEAVARNLFSDASIYSIAGHDFFHNAYRVGHHFKQTVVLGSKITDESQLMNSQDVMARFLGDEPGTARHLFAPERILRSEAKLSFMKEILGRPANLWVTADAPWNVTQRVLEFDFELRRGDDPGQPGVLSPQDFSEFGPILESFYRDMVVERLFRSLFDNIHVAGA